MDNSAVYVHLGPSRNLHGVLSTPETSQPERVQSTTEQDAARPTNTTQHTVPVQLYHKTQKTQEHDAQPITC